MNDRPTWGFLIVAALAGASCSPVALPRSVQEDLPVVAGEEGRSLDRFLQKLPALGVFSGSVLFARGDELLLHQGYGLADPNRGVAVEPESVFHIGSLGKQFTAAAVLLLASEGRLSLDDPLSRHLSNVPADKRAITIHQLLVHVSGLPPDYGPYFGAYETPDRDVVTDAILALPLRSMPGAAPAYSNPGYVLLAAIVERRAGQPYSRFLAERLFRPAGLRRTRVLGEVRNLPRDVLTVGLWGPYGTPSLADTPFSWYVSGAGSVVSSAGDLLRWYRALRGGRILPREWADRMFTAHEGFGYGWRIRSDENGAPRLIFHNGDAGTFAAAFRHYVGPDLVTVALTNWAVQDVKQHDDVLNNALDILDGKEVDLPIPSDRAVRLPADAEGTYRLDGGSHIELWRDGSGRLWAAAEGADAFAALWPHVKDFAERSGRGVRQTRAFLKEVLDVDPAEIPCPPGLPKWLAGVPQYVGDWERLRCDLRALVGAGSRVQIIGAAPITWSRDRVLTFTRAGTGRGQAATWLWDANGLVEAWTTPDVHCPQAVMLAESADGHLFHHDWFTGTTTPLRLLRSADGRISGLRIGDAGSEVEASASGGGAGCR